MRRFWSRVLVVLACLCLAVAVGCGDDDDDDGSSNSGGAGLSGGGGGGGYTCPELIDCLGDCDGREACYGACVDSSSDTVVRTADNLLSCVSQCQGSNDYCVQQECATYTDACYGTNYSSGGGGTGGGGGGSTGTATCSEVFDCWAGADTDAAAQACYESGDGDAQTKFMTFYNCLDQSGCFSAANSDEFANCAANNCSNEYVACRDDT